MSKSLVLLVYSETVVALRARTRVNLVSCVQQARDQAYAALTGCCVRDSVLRLVHADIIESLMVKAGLHLVEAPQYADCRTTQAREAFLVSYLSICLLTWLADHVAPEDRKSVAVTAETLLSAR